MPLRGPAAADGRDVVDAARLALADAGGKVGDLAVRGVYLDDTGGQGARAKWTPARAAANARRATEDSTAIAYLGDFDSGATRFSLPVTNEAHLLQVSPASGAVDLAQPFLGAGDQVPEEVQPTGERTFGRVIPGDEVQAQAGAVWAKRLGSRRPAVSRGSTSYDRTVATAFAEAARAIGLRAHSISQGGSTTSDLAYAALQAGDRRLSVLRAIPKVMGTDALLPPFVRRAPAAIDYATSAAEDPSQLPPAGRHFVKGFAMRYGRHPGRYAAYGYEAMAVILDSIRRAGSSGDERDSVVDAFFDTGDRRSILGTYSIDDVGDTTLGRLAAYRVVDGRAHFRTALQVH